ncbi:MAG: isoprenyl transferase [Acidobacteria bacterium]|nr:isoprenyl transferase [Acidobacteriota bacterium]
MNAPENTAPAEKILWERLDSSRLPEHVAIIMDGNGRWAKQRNLSRAKGHKAGVKAIRNALDTVLNLGIGNITLFAFSTENWTRPPMEVSVLMTLLRQFMRIELAKLMEKGIRMRALGDISKLPEPIRKGIYRVEEETKNNTRLCFNVALNYGGRAEILTAARRLLKSGIQPDELTEARFRQELYTAGLSDPDLLIRTSGEQRISNFLLWQLAYTELYFTDVLWPDFDTTQMLKALLDFQGRVRRFGGIHGD